MSGLINRLAGLVLIGFGVVLILAAVSML